MDHTRPDLTFSPDASLAEARNAQAEGRLDDAITMLETLLFRAPENLRALNMLGLMLLRQGDASRARATLQKATTADPAAASLWLNLAQACRALNDDGGERRSLTAALDRDPYLLIAHVRKAELHARLDEEAAALEEWQAVLTLCSAENTPSETVLRLMDVARDYIELQADRMATRLHAGLLAARSRWSMHDMRRFDVAVDHAEGRRKIYASQSSGLHFPFLPADEFFPRSLFPWLDVIEAATNDIRSELQAALQADGASFAPYVDQASGAAENIWTELSRSKRWSAYYLWRYGARNDAACLQCPATAKALEALPRADQPNRAPTAFFSLLAPGTRIPPHTGVTNTRAIVHLPLVVPSDCGFRVGGETRQWRVGEAFVFDDTIEHEAWNNSGEQRAVLIFDVWNPYLTDVERDLLRAFYTSADSAGLTPERHGSFDDR